MKGQLLLLSFKDKFKAFTQEKLLELEKNIIINTAKNGNTTSLKYFVKAVTHILKGEESSLTRPLLVYSSCTGFNHSEQTALEIAYCIELIHSMSLILDDLPSMDNANIRRGQPTTHLVYGENISILAAFTLYTNALQTFTSLDSKNLKKATSTLFNNLQNVIKGQVIDIKISPHNATTEMIDEMHILKTGYLIRSCLVIPALLAPANDIDQPVITALEKASDALGLAYQIRDDLLDMLSNSIEIQKSSNLDAINLKPSYARKLGTQASIKRLIDLFNDIFHSIKEIESINPIYDFSLLKLLVEQVMIKSLELKTFLPTQQQQLKQHYQIVNSGLKNINQNISRNENNFIYYYAYGQCFPLYSPHFKHFINSISTSYREIEKNLINFIIKNKLHLPLEHERDLVNQLAIKDISYFSKIKLRKIQQAKFSILLSLATNTQTFIKNTEALQIIVDFTTYTFLLDDKYDKFPLEKIAGASKQIISRFELADNFQENLAPEYQAATALSQRILDLIISLYGKDCKYQTVTYNFIQSFTELLESAVREREFNEKSHDKLNFIEAYLNYIEIRKITIGYLPVLRLTYIFLGIPYFSHHKIEELTSLAIMKVNDFVSLRKEMYDAGFSILEISQLYSSDQSLTYDPKLPNNIIVLRALKDNISIKHAIFQELADYTRIIEQIDNLVNDNAANYSQPEKEALIINQRWASFANVLWSLLTERYVGNHELVYNQFHALCLRNQQNKHFNRLSPQAFIASFFGTRARTQNISQSANMPRLAISAKL